ncbi:hypothetical protein CPB85DRAFT_1329921 [Mucidula mucida]|nr:hypothetical protein CPB85DRAFT_1329921 [Mucidula mucida]
MRTNIEPKLPQELLDHIVDDLWDDRRTLVTLLLVAHRFGERCRRWIYHTLHLTNDDCSHPHDRRVPLTAFYKHVMRYPLSGCPRVHFLTITLESPTNNRLSGRIKAVLFYAFNLQELSVHFAQCSPEWALNYPRLFRTLASPSVVTLELTCFEDWTTLEDYSGEQIAQLLAKFPRLRCLKAGGTLRPIRSDPTKSLPPIEALHISADSLYCLQTPPFAMCALRDLVIDYGELFTSSATGLRMAHKSFLSAIPESVQSLSIIVETSCLHGYTVDEVLLQTGLVHRFAALGLARGHCHHITKANNDGRYHSQYH